MKHEFDQAGSGRPGRGESQATRLRRRARSYLGQGVGSALAGTLGALGERLGQSLGGREEARVGKQRLEEVLERDRAQCGSAREPRPSAPPASAAPESAPPAASAPPERASAPPASAKPAQSGRERDEDLGGVEPIRTRTMARLLAEQGYTKRALAIYDELIARDPADAALREAAARLRAPRSA
jgi:hypothetical protein